MSDFNLDFPISFVKREERIVVGIATADNIDKVGDVVDFEASIDAFKNWAGNIREMHSPIAVGKAINYEPIKIKGEDGQEYNAIKVEAYISKGAQNTWEKILDGTLRAFSIGGSIVEKKADPMRIFRGKPVNIIKKYRLGELSLVDNPANALATVDIVKMSKDGDLEYVLEDLINKAAKQPLKDPKGGLTAAGRRHFKQTEGANLKPGVRGPANTPEKMRRKGSFLTRFFTNPSGPMKDEKGRPTRLALSAAAWGEPVPQDMQAAARLAAKGRRLLERYAKIKEKNSSKSIDEILQEDEDLLQKQMEYLLNIDELELFKYIDVNEEDLELAFKSLTQWFRENWVDISRPKPGGGFEPCGRPDAGQGKYPKCVPASRAAKMTQEQIDSAVRRKRRAESTTRREDKKPIYVSTDTEKAISTNVPNNPELYERVKAEAKRKFRVYPSVYANAWLVREYKKRGGTYRMTKEGEVSTQTMASGIKNPTQGYPSKGKKKKKETDDGMSKSEDLTQSENISNENTDITDFIKTQDELLQNHVQYDTVGNMNEQELRKSFVRRMIQWLVPDVQEGASTSVEVSETTQEEETMDIEILKDALGAVVDEKLAVFATSIKEEVEAAVQEKIDNITKSFDAQATELQEKLQAAEKSLADQEEQVKAFGKAGAIKKSVDPEDDDEGEQIVKSQPASVWNNVYLPQGLISSLGYKS